MGWSTRVQVFPSDVIVKVGRGRGSSIRSVRGKVREFSDRSKRRLLFSAFNACVDWFAFITLTYPMEFPSDGPTTKAHLHKFLVYLHRRYPSIKYLAALEFQERGAPHFHILVSEFVDLRWLSETWYRVVGSEDPKHLRAGTSVQLVSGRKEGAGYMAKVYTAKGFQKQVPEGFADVGRFWFSSRGLVQVERELSIEEYSQAVRFVRTLRKFVERSLKPRKRRPMRDGHKRKRKVKRAPSLQYLHTGFKGLTAYNASGLASRLLAGLGVSSLDAQKEYAERLGIAVSDVWATLPSP